MIFMMERLTFCRVSRLRADAHGYTLSPFRGLVDAGESGGGRGADGC